jgi:hypothetical protein
MEIKLLSHLMKVLHLMTLSSQQFYVAPYLMCMTLSENIHRDWSYSQ